MIVESFIGPSNTAQAVTADADRTINCYEEPIKPGSGKSDAWLRKVPGLAVFSSLGGTGFATYMFQINGLVYACVGTSFFQIFVDGSNVNRGTIAFDPEIVPTMCSNGTAGGQIFITSGLNGYIYDIDLGTLTLIADADFPQGQAQAGEFMDGYFIVLIQNTRRFQISALEDGTSWDALDFGERSEAADNLVAMKRNHREIWFLGNNTGEVWYDNGDADFPFAPIQGVFIEQGAIQTFSLQRIGNTVIWVSHDADGVGMVNMADGYTPTRVSTYALENQQLSQLTGSGVIVAWTYQEVGHWFYLIHVDGEQTTWTYDLSTNRWHERASSVDDATDPWVWTPNRPISHCYGFGRHLVGDRITGTIYDQSSNYFAQDLAPT